MRFETLDLLRIALKKVARRDARSKVGQDFQAIVDEIGDAKFETDRCLFVTLAAEADMIGTDPDQLIEVMVRQPTDGLFLSVRTALRDKKDVLVAFGLEATQSVENVQCRRCVEIILSKERGIGIVVRLVDDDAADIDAQNSTLFQFLISFFFFVYCQTEIAWFHDIKTQIVRHVNAFICHPRAPSGIQSILGVRPTKPDWIPAFARMTK